jgi:ABC-type uncharacterized transport system substrate-binding protein
MNSLAALAAGSAITVAYQTGHTQQQASPRRIGVLKGGGWSEEILQGFRQGLLDGGYVEGRDVVIEWRFAQGDYSRVPGLVADLLQHNVEVIVVTNTQEAQAAKRATSNIPIVMASIADPVGSGLVPSLAHPDSNITGVSLMARELGVKRLQLLKEAIPRLTRIAVFWNPDAPLHRRVLNDFKEIAPSLSVELTFVSVRTPEQFEAGFATIRRAHAEALYVIEDGFFYANRAKVLKLASKAGLPVTYGARQYAEEGALMFYGANFGDLFRRAAGYVVKILQGAKPSDLSIEQPTKFELVVNLKAAKALGITIPEPFLLRVDEVIQ